MTAQSTLAELMRIEDYRVNLTIPEIAAAHFAPPCCMICRMPSA